MFCVLTESQFSIQNLAWETKEYFHLPCFFGDNIFYQTNVLLDILISSSTDSKSNKPNLDPKGPIIISPIICGSLNIFSQVFILENSLLIWKKQRDFFLLCTNHKNLNIDLKGKRWKYVRVGAHGKNSYYHTHIPRKLQHNYVVNVSAMEFKLIIFIILCNIHSNVDISYFSLHDILNPNVHLIHISLKSYSKLSPILTLWFNATIV